VSRLLKAPVRFEFVSLLAPRTRKLIPSDIRSMDEKTNFGIETLESRAQISKSKYLRCVR
jgi:hypothetical protein